MPDRTLDAVIREALTAARAVRKDRLTQTEEAVRAALDARPGMTASEALTQVRLDERSMAQDG